MGSHQFTRRWKCRKFCAGLQSLASEQPDDDVIGFLSVVQSYRCGGRHCSGELRYRFVRFEYLNTVRKSGCPFYWRTQRFRFRDCTDASDPLARFGERRQIMPTILNMKAHISCWRFTPALMRALWLGHFNYRLFWNNARDNLKKIFISGLWFHRLCIASHYAMRL